MARFGFSECHWQLACQCWHGRTSRPWHPEGRANNCWDSYQRWVHIRECGCPDNLHNCNQRIRMADCAFRAPLKQCLARGDSSPHEDRFCKCCGKPSPRFKVGRLAVAAGFVVLCVAALALLQNWDLSMQESFAARPPDEDNDVNVRLKWAPNGDQNKALGKRSGAPPTTLRP